MGAIANLGTRNVAVAPGAQATADIRVRNNGTVVDQFSIQVLGDAGAWSVAEPPVISLFPGAEQAVRITFKPPRSSDVPAGPMAFGVRVASQEDPAGSVVEEGVLQIGAFSDTTAELAPRTSRGRTGASHDLAVDNRGNTQLNATITGLDPDRTIAFDIKPPSVVADPGTATFAKVGIKPRKRFWRGQPKTRSFQLQLDSPGQPPVIVGGSMLQESILPSWFLKALLLLLGALIALLLIWFLFLRPVIVSTAQERTDAALVQAGIQPPVDGSGGGKSPAPAKTPSPGTTPAPGETTAPPKPTPTPGPAGIETPRDGRLDVNGDPASATDGRTLFITDLVFSNPNASTGALRLRRSGQDLMVLRLENFRDLDFHFVTPIAVGPGQQLRLACEGPCEAAGLFFSGFER
ncbi:MAG: hypothetical protein LH650_10445 [Chloroflexi bacterium]|nr:hypothetical protein [Chloroflexota bacterium]